MARCKTKCPRWFTKQASSMVDSRPQAMETEPTPTLATADRSSRWSRRVSSWRRWCRGGTGVGVWWSGFGGDPRPAAVAKPPGLRLDPNTVPPEVLTALPHVGSALVDRWVKAREERPFRSLEDAQARVAGSGAATLAQIAPYFEDPEGRRLSTKLREPKTAGRRQSYEPRSGKNQVRRRRQRRNQPRLAASSDIEIVDS